MKNKLLVCIALLKMQTLVAISPSAPRAYPIPSAPPAPSAPFEPGAYPVPSAPYEPSVPSAPPPPFAPHTGAEITEHNREEDRLARERIELDKEKKRLDKQKKELQKKQEQEKRKLSEEERRFMFQMGEFALVAIREGYGPEVLGSSATLGGFYYLHPKGILNVPCALATLTTAFIVNQIKNRYQSKTKKERRPVLTVNIEV